MARADLSGMRCKPCSGGTPPLAGDSLAEYMMQVPQWRLVEGNRIARSWRFDDFKQAWSFVDHVSELAEQQGHHPRMCFTWGKVDIELATHKIGGLSESDFILAAKIDRLGL